MNICADALHIPLASGIVQTVITSPPYYGLRDYGIPGQLGLEKTPEAYIAQMVAVFREVRRVLRDDGTLWLNVGDSYAREGGKTAGVPRHWDGRQHDPGGLHDKRSLASEIGMKEKDLIGIPWLLAKALQAPYYTGVIKREIDRVWLAATIDGEGTICGFDVIRSDDGSPRTGVNICITNSSTAMLDEAQRIFPASHHDHQIPHEGHLGLLPTYRWIVTNMDDRLMLMRELYPYLIVKKKQALLAYNLLLFMQKAKHYGHTPQRDEIRGMRSLLANLLSDANNMRPVDIPDWCVEPPPCYEPGWYLRSDIIWSKSNPMPESVTDRPTKSHEYIFLLTKSARYFWDQEAVREPIAESTAEDPRLWKEGYQAKQPERGYPGGNHNHGSGLLQPNPSGRNLRTVWTIPTQPTREAHFATYPEALVERCIRAGTSERGCCPKCGDPWVRDIKRVANYEKRQDRSQPDGVMPQVDSSGWKPATVTDNGWRPGCTCNAGDPIPCLVFDPFLGSGTTARVAIRLGRRAVGTELSWKYLTEIVPVRTTVQAGLQGLA